MSLKNAKIKANYDTLWLKIRRSLSPSSQRKVQLIAVSKKQSAEDIMFLSSLGQSFFGESYCQEMEEKDRILRKQGYFDHSWVFIGRLQSNKIKKIVALSNEIQSLASLKHAKQVNDYAFALKKTPFKVYLLVNAAGEASKSGFLWDELSKVVEVIERDLSGLELQGLMAIPPKIDLICKPFSYYENLYKKIAEESRKVGKGLLSLGMSQDLELALACGTNCIRIGTGLFGPRV